MHQPRNLDELLSRLGNLSKVVKDEPPLSSTTEHTSNSYTDITKEKLNEFAKILERENKIIDPKVIAQQKKLPIYQKRNELLRVIENNQILIIIGETGSGKTTQIPQYLKDTGVAVAGKIGCTQLRRMAAKAVAKRVAKEQGCELGEEVGYTIRFEDKTSEKTVIQYMTDGILLRECTRDRMLSNYSAIILDESHERSIDTDILLAVLKWITGKRNDLKLIISSATLDAAKFSSYFYRATVFEISGRMFPVEYKYLPASSYKDYQDLAVERIIKINESADSGDILVFMTGEDDIENLADRLSDYQNSLYPELVVLPCYSALPWDRQAQIFESAGKNKRKVVIATNIAETSLTLDGIKFVIDSGYVKQKVYDAKIQMEVLKRVPISQAQAVQRAGRAGRVGPGICYRLYTKDYFDKLVANPDPEIKRSNLTNAVLLLKQMGFTDLDEFDFLDKPPKEIINEAISELELFGAIEGGRTGCITEIGKKMAGFPLEPNLAKMLIVSEQLSCTEEVLTIVALLSVSNIHYRPRKKQKLADLAKSRFASNQGDLISMLKVYKEWCLMEGDKQWCHDNFINGRMVEQAYYIREQLLDIVKSRSMKIKSSEPNYVPVLKCICAGFFQNVAQKRTLLKNRNFEYITLPKNEIVFIHPGSFVHKVNPNWVVYQKIVKTTKEYMRGVTPIEIEWIKEFSPAFDKQIGHRTFFNNCYA